MSAIHSRWGVCGKCRKYLPTCGNLRHPTPSEACACAGASYETSRLRRIIKPYVSGTDRRPLWVKALELRGARGAS